MTFGKKLLQLRKRDGYTQEELAEMLGVSRQTISRWEMETAVPDSDNLLNISKLFAVSTDYLLNDDFESEGDAHQAKRPNRILQMNLTLIAIIAQTVCLSGAMKPLQEVQTPYMQRTEFILKFVPLLASSVWMAFNLRYEKNLVQYRKNVKIELVYCLLQACIFLFGYYSKIYRVATALMVSVSLTYILYINPVYMNRQMTRKKSEKR